jgi:hypothetical protein
MLVSMFKAKMATFLALTTFVVIASTPITLYTYAGGPNTNTSTEFLDHVNGSIFATYTPGTASSYNATADPFLISQASPYELSFEAVIDPPPPAYGSTAGFTSTLSTVPEPGLYGIMAVGLSGLFVAVSRRRSRRTKP